MSKTHKITQLKKRIAELEGRLNNPPLLKVYKTDAPVTTVKAERHITQFEFDHFWHDPKFRQSVITSLLLDMAEDPALMANAMVRLRMPDDYLSPVFVRMAFNVMPFHGDIWEDNE